MFALLHETRCVGAGPRCGPTSRFSGIHAHSNCVGSSRSLATAPARCAYGQTGFEYSTYSAADPAPATPNALAAACAAPPAPGRRVGSGVGVCAVGHGKLAVGVCALDHESAANGRSGAGAARPSSRLSAMAGSSASSRRYLESVGVARPCTVSPCSHR